MEVRGREGGKGTTGKSNKSIPQGGGAPLGAPPKAAPMLLFDFPVVPLPPTLPRNSIPPLAG